MAFRELVCPLLRLYSLFLGTTNHILTITAGLIYFLLSAKDREVIVPRKTAASWTPDCFLVCFAKFLERAPNPILWLEAELDDEERRQGMGLATCLMPWKGTIASKEVAAVVAWEDMVGLEEAVGWSGVETRYPKRFMAEVSAR